MNPCHPSAHALKLREETIGREISVILSLFTARALNLSEETTGRDRQVQICVILSEGWVGPRGAKDLRADRESAPGFVRRSFAPTPAPTLSLRMTDGRFWALDNERRNSASPHKHWEFLGSEAGWVGVQRRMTLTLASVSPVDFFTPSERGRRWEGAKSQIQAHGSCRSKSLLLAPCLILHSHPTYRPPFRMTRIEDNGRAVAQVADLK